MAKKHKKKVYNTPKKNKHVNKNISPDKFINSYYNNRCTQCHSILANHIDRIYCGKCHISLKA